MAQSPASIFEQLRSPESIKIEEEKTKAAIEKEQEQYERNQIRLAELADSNSTLPCTVNSVRILHAPNTRKDFLQHVVAPLLKANNDRTYTLSETLQLAHDAAQKLRKFNIFEPPITLYIDKPSPISPSTTPTDLDIYLSVREKSCIQITSGTDVGNTEGSAYANILYRNIFGGAETLALNASLGTRTRSSYQGALDTPLFSNPDLTLELGGAASATKNGWASHEEVVKGGWAKLRWFAGSVHRHEWAYNGAWRQVTGLAGGASPTVRMDAGDSVKSSMAHTWAADWRDNPRLPSYGVYAKTINEIAGYGPLGGDVAFWKTQVEGQGVLPIPIPAIRESGVTFTTGLRAGLLWPLGLKGENAPKESRINDRFLLGGPTDVRGFRIGGVGPHDGSDAVGGDLYAAGGANLLFPLPGVGPRRPLRAQFFINSGRLLALAPPDLGDVPKRIKSTIRELGDGLPSTAVGLGLVYAHPMARLELNFSLPLVQRKGEDPRKGLMFGLGINFL